jgi:hypothetical protein
MTKDLPGEKWKKVVFDFKFTNNYQLEVSNSGRLRTTNKHSSGVLLNGSMVNGYKIVRLKFFSEREPAVQKSFENLQKNIATLNRKIKKLTESKAKKSEVKTVSDQLLALRKKVSEKFSTDAKNRTIYYQKLIHRLVAEYFLPKPAASKTVVAHLDFNKINNKASNLKWMSPDENYKHQQNSPLVIEEKKMRRDSRQRPSSTTKLNANKVMLLKKLLNEGKAIKSLVKQFKVTDTQILRIKRGENWSNIEAAK